MNNELKMIITKEYLSRIQAVARDGSVQGAVISLMTWGFINVGAWFILGTESREFISKLASNPAGDIYILLYGGLFLGSVILTFAVVGYITRISATIFLDSLSLFAVGIWNIMHDIIAAAALRPYGYAIVKSSTIWVMLGVCQLVWGARQFLSFWRIKSWSPAHIDRSELQDLKNQLQQFVNMAENFNDEIVKMTITVKGPLGLGFLSQKKQYTGRLLDDSALMISSKLDDYLMIPRKAMENSSLDSIIPLTGAIDVESFASISSSGLSVNIEGEPINMDINELSIIIFKKWCGKSLTTTEIKSVEAITGTIINSTEINKQIKENKEKLKDKYINDYKMIEGEAGEAFCIACKQASPINGMFHHKTTDTYYHRNCLPIVE
jgi:hypothetical protein